MKVLTDVVVVFLHLRIAHDHWLQKVFFLRFTHFQITVRLFILIIIEILFHKIAFLIFNLFVEIEFLLLLLNCL